MVRFTTPSLRRLPRFPRLGLLPRIVAALAVVALMAGAYAFWPRTDNIKVTGEFSRAVGLFPGSDVRILGVKVGEVTEVTPQGDKVVVTFEFDGKYSVPADAKAAVVAPSLVSDRYVQLLPAYQPGQPKMVDGARIGLDRTAVPVELDRISQSLDDLLVALGPDGANKNGAFSDLLETGAQNLDGQGQNLHDMNRDLSKALETMSGGRNDLFGTVKNLQSFTSMLAENDAQVRRLNKDLASVSVQLDGERDDLAAALKNLAIALNEVSSFVHDNRAGIKTNVDQLAAVTGTVAQQRDALAETLTNAPVAISNLQNAYNPKTGTLDTRGNVEQFDDPALLLCSLFTAPGGKGSPADLCRNLHTALDPVTGALDQLGGGGVKLPLNLLSAVPASGQAAVSPEAGVQMRGADPTLGGLLEVSR
jgi:phospholipid/cholesterol/gamma-HCH transport system substrate-binding protein